MKAVLIEDGKAISKSIDKPSGDGVVVKVVSSSICGSDLHMLERGMLEGKVPGHEFAGYTPDGTAVAIEPIYGCGTCGFCEDGYSNYCTHGATLIGGRINGGMAEYVEVPAQTLYELPTGLDITIASLVEPLAVAVNGIHQITVNTSEKVLVIGAGAIGIATAAVLQAKGVTYDIIARHPHQKEAALKLGAGLDVTDGYDLVIDAAATKDTMTEAINRLRPRGRLLVLGTHWEPAPFSMAACVKSLTVLCTTAYKVREPNRSFAEAGNILHANPHIADAMITHDYPLDGATEAFACASDKSTGSIKVRFLT